MPPQAKTDRMVDEYLEELRIAMATIDPEARENFLSEIEEHIAEGRATFDINDEVALAGLLRRIGAPKDLAKEWLEIRSDSVLDSRPSGMKQYGLRRSVALVACVAIVTLVALGIILADRYQPLMQGDAPTSRVINAAGRVAEHKFIYAPGLPVATAWIEPQGLFTVEVIASIKNNGWLPVELRTVRIDAQGYRLRDPGISINSSHSGQDWNGSHQFQPVSISGHSSRNFEFHYTQSCIPAPSGSFVTLQSLKVKYKFLQIQHTIVIPIQKFVIRNRPHC